METSSAWKNKANKRMHKKRGCASQFQDRKCAAVKSQCLEVDWNSSLLDLCNCIPDFLPVKAVGRHLSWPLTEVGPKEGNLHVVHEVLGLAGQGLLAKDVDEPVVAEKGFHQIADCFLC